MFLRAKLTTCGIPPGGIPAGSGIIPAWPGTGGIPVLTVIGTEGTTGGIPDIWGGGMPPCTIIWGIMPILGNIPWGITPKGAPKEFTMKLSSYIYH